MPINQINYQNTIIYKLVCKDINITECYVGHTTDFKSRKYAHKTCCNNINNNTGNNYNSNLYIFIRANGGFENWDMIEIEKCNCVDALDATKQERVWIEKLKSTLNSNIPTRTLHEWYVENIEKIQKQKQIYNEENKEKINNQKKEYYNKNKNEILEYHKEYYQKNKEKFKEQTTCVCGSTFVKQQIKRHEQTQKHIRFVKKQLVKI